MARAKAWVILRCSNAKTLELARSLADDGFEAWTPAETVTRRSRQGGKPEPIQMPLTPSFVFAKADRVLDLLALSHSPTLNYQVWDSEKRRMVTRGHPHFRLFQHLGEIAGLADVQLAALRELERKSTPKPDVEPIGIDTDVRLTEAGFEGLTGKVIASRKTYTRIQIDGWIIPVDFPTWIIREQLDNQGDDGVGAVKALHAKAA